MEEKVKKMDKKELLEQALKEHEIKMSVMSLIEKFSGEHELAKERGSEYIMQNELAQIHAIALVCDIFDVYAEHGGQNGN